MIQLEAVYFDDFTPNWNLTRRETKSCIIVLVTHGQLIYHLDKTYETLAKGDLLFIAPGIERTGLSGQFPPHQKYAFHFQLQHDQISTPPFGSQGYAIFKPRNLEYLRQRFSLLFQTWTAKGPYYHYICHGIALELYGNVLREWEQKAIPHHKLEIAKQIEKYIFQHYRDEIRIENLAELVQRTPNYVSTIFKEVTGQTIIEFIHQFRISAARDLLLHSDMNISEISDHLGFCDPSYFNRIFKKITGQPPSAMLKLRNSQGKPI